MEEAPIEFRLRERAVLTELIAILEDMTGDWDLEFSGGIGPRTHLIADLAFESIDVVQLVVVLEERFERRDIPFEQLLMENGRYVDDLTVLEVAQFLDQQMNG